METLESNNAVKISDPAAIRQVKIFKGLFSFGHITLESLVEAGFLDANYAYNAWKFAVVRNPYDRAVSLFEYLKKLRTLPLETTFALFCDYLRAGSYSPVGLYNEQSLSLVNRQVSWVFPSNERLHADYVVHFETLKDDFIKVFDTLGLQASSFGFHNKSVRRPITDYYTESEKKIVRSVYQEDFFAFSYGDDLDELCPRSYKMGL
jgi:hypothetical protein